MKLTQILVLLLCCLVSAGLALFAERTYFAPASAAENAFISSERPDREVLRKQAFIGSNINSITLGGTQILNWRDAEMENTLHHDLMMIESIYEKRSLLL